MDRAIRLYQRARGFGDAAQFSHVELVFNRSLNELPWPPGVVSEADEGKTYCFSSSPRDGGTRFKWIYLAHEKWKLLDLPAFADRDVWEYCSLKLRGRKYDWTAIFGLAFGDEESHDADSLMCSETAVVVEQNFGKLTDLQAWKVCPAHLYQRTTTDASLARITAML